MCLKDFKKLSKIARPGGDDVYRSGLVIIELFTGVVLGPEIRDKLDAAMPACHPHVWDKVVKPLLNQADCRIISSLYSIQGFIPFAFC